MVRFHLASLLHPFKSLHAQAGAPCQEFARDEHIENVWGFTPMEAHEPRQPLGLTQSFIGLSMIPRRRP